MLKLHSRIMVPPPLGRDLPQLLPRHARNSPSFTRSHTQLQHFRPLPGLRRPAGLASPLPSPALQKPLGKGAVQGEAAAAAAPPPELSPPRSPSPGKREGYFRQEEGAPAGPRESRLVARGRRSYPEPTPRGEAPLRLFPLLEG